MVRVNNTLKYWREKVGATQKGLELRTGLAPNNWTHYEAGREPGVTKAQLFTYALNQIAVEKGIEIKTLTVYDLYPFEGISHR